MTKQPLKHIVKHTVKSIFKLLIILAVLECAYLYALPPVIEKFADKAKLCSFISSCADLKIEAETLVLRPRFPLSLAVKAENISAFNKTAGSKLFSSSYLDFELPLAPLILKTVSPEHFYADNFDISINQDKTGSFNYENLFTIGNNSSFKVKLNNIDIKTAGSASVNGGSRFDFEINAEYSAPFSLKNFSKNNLNGSIFIYNADLKQLSPLLKKYLPDFKTVSGLIDYMQISFSKKDDKTMQTVINTKFKEVLYSQKNWINHIYAAGDNKAVISAELFGNTINIKHFKYDADKIDIAASGLIDVKNKPVLDIDAEVKNSRAENIASILPPNLEKERMVIEKIKSYGIKGDIEGRAHIKGACPHPDITGYAKGRNVHILDARLQKQHTGTIDLTFNGRTLNMDILINMPDNQKAEIKGMTYMYRDGINDVTVKTTGRLNFPLAHKLVLPVSEVFYFQLGPLHDMDMTSGRGVLDLHIKGNLDFVNIYGSGSFENAAFTHKELFGNITRAKGKIDFKDDNIYIRTASGFIENNPFSVSGNVKINNNLDLNIKSDEINSADLLKIIKKSSMLKDLNEGLSVFSNVQGSSNLGFNLKAQIVPVKFGQPPLPAAEALKNIKVKGALSLNGIQCFLKGFKTPIDNVSGNVNFTEEQADFDNIRGIIGSSEAYLKGKVITSLKTKIPNIELEAESSSFKTGDTIRFLAESYFYPEEYPPIDSLYNLDAKHTLYMKYKAKSKDFLVKNTHAEINLLENTGSNAIKAKSGRLLLENGNVKIEDINAEIFNSNINISGAVKNAGEKNPQYDISAHADKFDLANLNRINELSIMPEKIISAFKNFSSCKGAADINIQIKDNVLKASADASEFSFIHKASGAPVKFDSFTAFLEDDVLKAENITADIADTPVFISLKAENIYKEPYISGRVSSKLTNKLIKTLMPENISKKLDITGAVNISSSIKGSINNLHLEPKITLFPGADAAAANAKIGDSSDKREFDFEINTSDNTIDISRMNYYVYISALNKTVRPVLFVSGSGKLELNKETGLYEVSSAALKTEKNISARLLNIFLDKPLFRQGFASGDIKYSNGIISGEMEARNIDIPLADTVIKNIRLNSDEENIYIKLFGFINDTAVRVSSSIDNNLKQKPHMDYLNIKADKIDADKLLLSINNAKSAFNIQTGGKEAAPFDLQLLQIENGTMHADEFIFKNCTAKDIESGFSIDKTGSVKLEDIRINLADGTVSGGIEYSPAGNKIELQLGFRNIDSNYIAENLLNAKNQIYGSADAEVLLKTQGSSTEDLIRNLSGIAYFEISDGKMPKLGSLEYLLRAGNIFKSGVTGFTMNNMLEILNLVKTGYFTNINGRCELNKGKAENVEIFSRGDNLSLYLHGSYNIPDSDIDAELLGRVSNKISTILGPVGNTSINSMFKRTSGMSLLSYNKKHPQNTAKIPSLTGGDYDSRLFQAVIKGEINSSDSVQSFKWFK